jgi:hypothetical protein
LRRNPPESRGLEKILATDGTDEVKAEIGKAESRNPESVKSVKSAVHLPADDADGRR